MNTQFSWRKNFFKRITSKMGTVAMFAMMALFFTPAVYADMAADTEILNVVTVTYYDASGTYDFSASAAATVTVSLVQSEVTISGRPTITSGQHGAQATLPSDQNLQSGITASYLYAITSNANGEDTYDISIIDTPAGILTNPTVTTQIVEPDGSTFLQDSTVPLTLGASVIVDVSGTTLSFPGGTLTGIAAGDVVVIDNEDYLVGPVTYGNAASYDAGTGSTTAETRATMQLLQNTNGGQADPLSASFSIGTPVYEQALLRVLVTAINTDASAGTVDVDIAVDVTTEIGPTINPVTVDNQITTFAGLSLTIEKLVSNVTDATGFAANVPGVSGDTLEYRVTVTNNGGNAAFVVIDDSVPVYTELVGDTAYTDGFAYYTYTHADASVTSGSIDMATGTEHANDVSGTAGDTVASTPLTFYVGQGHDGTDGTSSGGLLLGGETVVITYQVTID
jgi:uncharacterized repeat protein (TIGR01451 family)